MRKLYTLILLAIFPVAMNAQSYCDPQGNVVIYSNYDGGPLIINVDQNIPNLKIGVLSYEFSRIQVIGQYASNVTQIWWVGYNGNNDHCSIGAPFYTTITGVPNAVDSILLYPAATYSNPNGYNAMICNYSCNTTTNQGGCNTADQTAHYFLTQFGGSLYYHATGYGCWPDTVFLSVGGNCCANPLTTIESETASAFTMSPNPAHENVTFTFGADNDVQTIEIVNLLGEAVSCTQVAAGTTSLQISVADLAPGTYIVKTNSSTGTYSEKLIVAE